MLAIETNKLMCACKYAGILLLWGALTISKLRFICCFFCIQISPFYPLKPHLLHLKSIAFSPQKMMFYLLKAMLSQLQTYAFRKSMLVFVKINAYFFVELKC
jgi:hypothetical protein